MAFLAAFIITLWTPPKCGPPGRLKLRLILSLTVVHWGLRIHSSHLSPLKCFFSGTNDDCRWHAKTTFWFVDCSLGALSSSNSFGRQRNSIFGHFDFSSNNHFGALHRNILCDNSWGVAPLVHKSAELPPVAQCFHWDGISVTTKLLKTSKPLLLR